MFCSKLCLLSCCFPFVSVWDLLVFSSRLDHVTESQPAPAHWHWSRFDIIHSSFTLFTPALYLYWAALAENECTMWYTGRLWPAAGAFIATDPETSDLNAHGMIAGVRHQGELKSCSRQQHSCSHGPWGMLGKERERDREREAWSFLFSTPAGGQLPEGIYTQHNTMHSALQCTWVYVEHLYLYLAYSIYSIFINFTIRVQIMFN